MTSANPPRFNRLEVGAQGECTPMQLPTSGLDLFPERHPYRFCRFLCDLEDMVASVADDRDRVRIATILVHRLITQSLWIYQACPHPDPESGISTQRLYREPGYPFTVKIVAWSPGLQSPVHNHAAWSVIALLGDSTCGQEKNQFWCRQDDGQQANFAHLLPASQCVLKPGDILGMMPDAIHNICSLSSANAQKPTYTFNVYGAADLRHRYIFDTDKNTQQNH
ncbi:cupin [Acaryochloris marina]|uniref:cysteine dioxygenase family protein n=1 Tax=Acaryochloris marina TaxID=155978 RepID=UPI001BAECC02|nr:cupin [Acaryochloris marina]QUY41561.1 cupin [Acaryochloris marina S15]